MVVLAPFSSNFRTKFRTELFVQTTDEEAGLSASFPDSPISAMPV
jgi:hypothetical protein